MPTHHLLKPALTSFTSRSLRFRISKRSSLATRSTFLSARVRCALNLVWTAVQLLRMWF